MKKILMFVNVDWFFLSHRLPIARAASAKGVNMKVFTSFTQQHNEDDYGDFSFLQSPIRRKNVFFIIDFFKTINLLRKERPDLVHAVTIKPIIFIGVIALFMRIPFIASISGLGPAFKPTNHIERLRVIIIKLIYRIIFFPAKTKVICQSSHDAKVLTDNGLVSLKKITLIDGSGVDLNKFFPKGKTPEDSIKILMASRFLIDKGLNEYCEAASIIKNTSLSNVSFMLAGRSDEYNPYSLSKEEVIKLCNINGVEFLGNRSDIQNVLAKTDIFVLPSFYPEGIPKVLLEAAACGCAIITTDHPGCRDAIIHEHTGLLAAPKDVKSLVSCLCRMIDDHNLMKSMGKAGRKLAEERFSIDNVIDSHFSLYLN